MTKNIKILYSDKFIKDVKKLSKKYQSLEDDIKILEIQLGDNPYIHIKIEGIGDGVEGVFYKVKKFRCKSISKSSVKSGIRIIYRYIEEVGELEFYEIEFIEVYHKNIKSDFDRTRLEKYKKE